jgi:hypothetical protein
MTISKWWMRAVGLFYLLIFVMAAIVKAPIREEGPAGALDLATRGDPMARFVVDTWVTFGLELGAVGVALLVASRVPDRARALIWTVGGMELAGIIADIYKIVRGYDLRAPLTWMVLHSVIIATGVWALRDSRRAVSTRFSQR